MNTSQVKSLLKNHHIAPLKSLGQHFLINEATGEHIIRIANITKYDTIIEIGAGLGILTQVLLVHAKKVLAVEIDRGFVEILNNRFRGRANLHIIHQDILSLSLKSYKLKAISSKARNKVLRPKSEVLISYKLIGNLPYNLTSKILEKFLQKEVLKPRLMVIMIQREVAERMTARPPNMNRLALLCQYYGKPEIILDVPPHHFWPQPRVHSSVVKIEVKSKEELPLTPRQEKTMWSVIKKAFSQPRKKLRNSIGINTSEFGEKRPEELGVEEWIKLVIK